ncbi:MMPL family transporter [Streptomyces sp. NEAU-H22]|uniref:MMPL family transporter n=1 Tax=unclassified Streptomyces TaxID=2593676 RepID=UPI00224E2ACC|nr:MULTISPECIES: MMPL family transporter [unclassified Streptomyces]MCX3289861.1 MMPL family transporter [Streptomyces sp. NEAU-H22]WMD06541.1 MMPL family transporter [Streptomyces sp. FXY-T5]
MPHSRTGEDDQKAARGGVLRRLGEWCARHFAIVIIAWLVALVALQVVSREFGGAYSDNFSLPQAQAQKGLDVLKAHDPQAGGYSSQIVMRDDQQPLTSLSSQMSTTVADLEKLPHVLSAQNPLSAPATPSGQQNVGPLSDDKKTAYVTVRFDVQPSTLGDDYLNGVDTAVQPLRSAGAEVEYGGPLGELARPAADDRVSELIGFGVAVIVLLVGFGSVIAAVVPLLSALISVVGGLAILGLLAAAFTFATVSPTLATMIGLGVGIDYALFMLTRHRQNLIDGMDPVRAAGQAASTSGHAVLVSGCTVIIALAGLSASGVSFISLLGVAAAVTVVSAVIGALTLVPALLGFIGRHIDRYHVRPPVAETEAGAGDTPQGTWHRYAQRVERRPLWFLSAGVAVVVVLAIPLFSIQLGHIGDGADPTSFTDRRAFDLMTDAFGPGSNGPLTVVIDQTNVPQSQRSALASKAQQSLDTVQGAAVVTPLTSTQDGDLLVNTVYSTRSPQNSATTDLANRLVDDTLPDAARGTDAKSYVTGTTATQVDFRDIVASQLPVIIAVVVGLAFLIILAVFRGLLVAVKAAVLNVLSIAASYGVVVAVFQWGWGGPALGVHGKVPIESYVPMMMFAIVFGLSMDYEIFLLSRVHEAWLRTGDAKRSVAHALEITARVITCAALIMVSVFAAFIVSDNIVVKMLGLGLAVSVLIDATVVRLLMVPAVMTLLGRHAWWMPRWLDRVMPHIDAEGAQAGTPSASS